MGIEDANMPDNRIDNVESKEVSNKLPDEVKDELVSDIEKTDKEVKNTSERIGIILKTIGLDDDGLDEIKYAFRDHDSDLDKVLIKISKGEVDNSNLKETQDDLNDLKLFIGQTVNALGNTTKADENVYVGGFDRRGGLTQRSASSIADMIKNKDVSKLKYYNDNGDTEINDPVDNTEEYVEDNEENEVETNYPKFSELNPFARNAITKMAYTDKPGMGYEEYYDKYKDSGKFDRYVNDENSKKADSISNKVRNFFN